MVTNSNAANASADMNDLGPLAWVLSELRKSLEAASKALKRVAKDADIERNSDLAAIDTSPLRIAREQFHQAVGALEIVGMAEPALLLQAMEATVQKFIQNPKLCTQDAVGKIEYASFALAEYLESVLAGKPFSAVSLFPQYRNVQELRHANRIHPADLWAYDWRWVEPQVTPALEGRSYDESARAALDQLTLQFIKGKAPQAAGGLKTLSQCFAAAQTEKAPKIFWLIAAGFFEASANNLINCDLYVRRAASQVLLQFASLSRGNAEISSRLSRDLLFFCSQAVATRATDTSVLSAVRLAYGLVRFKPVDYELIKFGQFDPAQLAQARKRILLAKDGWSLLCAGDNTKVKQVADQFSLVVDSLRKLNLASEPLAEALSRAIDVTLHKNQAPALPLAMEVATSMLYLEAVFDDLDPADPQVVVKTTNLAERLQGVINGGDSQPLTSWMEELYRRVSDRQIMTSVVTELRVSVAELEHGLDVFFRNPDDKTVLQLVPGQLSQIRGVLSVLGLDDACKAVVHMKSLVEQMLGSEFDEKRDPAQGVFEHFGNNLGVLSFLIDMLNYQPALVKRLFVYDETKHELTSLMGRPVGDTDAASSIAVNDSSVLPALEFTTDQDEIGVSSAGVDDAFDGTLVINNVAPYSLAFDGVNDENDAIFGVAVQAHELLDEISEELQTPSVSTLAPVIDDFEDDDLRDIFLEEAREVTAVALLAMEELQRHPDDPEHLNVLRRAFHTLKGSSRMVGLQEFGEASWAMEQLLSSWLAENKQATAEFLVLCNDVNTQLKHWIDDIANNCDSTWSSVGFCNSARMIQVDGRYLAVVPSAQARNTFESVPSAELPVSQIVPQTDTNFGNKENFESGGMDFDSLFLISSDSGTSITTSVIPDKLMPVPAVTETINSAAENLSGIKTVEEHFAIDREKENDSDSGTGEEEAVKVIEGLRIGIPLYNVYLNEADEWSRRLGIEIAEWALETQQPISASTVALAHSLAGSSATVGFIALSDLARALEHALDNSRTHHRHGANAYGQLFIEASEEIRRLLHQFAAGFLKLPDPGIVDRLVALEFSDSGVSKTDEYRQNYVIGDIRKFEIDSSDSAFGLIEDQKEPVEGGLDDQPIDIQLPFANLIPSPDRTAIFADYEDVRDDIDAVDVVDVDLFPIFEEECTELMPRLGSALRQWAQAPAEKEPRLEVLRVLHTLKGSARLAGAMRLGEMAHRIESEIAFIGSQALTSQDIEFLLNRFDGMQNVFEGLRQSEAAGSSLLSLKVDLAPVVAIEPDLQDIHVLSNEDQADTSCVLVNTSVITSANHVRQTEVPGPSAMVMQPLRQAANATVRVRTQLLDRMVNQAGEVMISRSRLEAEVGQLRISLNDMTGNLTRLRQQLRDIELQSETQMQSRLALAKEAQAGFDPLEFDRFTRVQELTRMMAESVNDVATVQRTLQRTIEATEDDLVAQGRQARELQRDLLRTRMVEFDSVSDRLYRVVRQTSKETGKQVRLDLQGGNLEMDRGMLDRMIPAFEHLLRNCITHGIEAAQVRAKAGKDAIGLITIQLRQEGNDVSIELNDDGSGLNLTRIRERGISQGLTRADQVIDDEAAANLIFLPGFSTAEEVTELAGRGIGLDVVRNEVISLGGRINTSSVAGKGTGFTMVLPLTTAVTQVVMIRAGSMSVGIPANVVQNVLRTPAASLQEAYRSGTLDVGGVAVPFFWSGALLQASHSSSEPQAKTTPVVIFRSAAQRIAMHVDEVLGTREVVVKNLGPQLSGLPGLTGMSTLPSGAVVLIYNPVALATVYGDQARTWSKDYLDLDGTRPDGTTAGRVPMVLTAPQAPLILVVDDSITVRRVTQRLLLRDGYRVAMAADGLQALERLQDEIPAVVLSDIEMPRMDGFDLVRNIRADHRMKGLPIIMITSRIAGKHNDHAVELGVNHYLGKPYSEEELMRLIRQYCSVQTAALA